METRGHLSRSRRVVASNKFLESMAEMESETRYVVGLGWRCPSSDEAHRAPAGLGQQVPAGSAISVRDGTDESRAASPAICALQAE